jgi:SAM-dependent methyltransferase
MENLTELKQPSGIDWQAWVERYDRMSERYFVRRDERFRIMVGLIREIRGQPARVLDLGCGAGLLMSYILEAFPRTEVVGIDLDPTALWLSEARLKPFGKRSRLVMSDFLKPSWTRDIDTPLDAVVSSQSIHMFSARQIPALYRRIAETLRPGGVFLSADHVKSDSPAIQKAWERERRDAVDKKARSRDEDWDVFWKEYSAALGVDLERIRRRLYGGREKGAEQRPTLAWHLSRLLKSGFSSAECFWRSEYDAVYGGEHAQ